MSANARSALNEQSEKSLSLDPNAEVQKVEDLGIEWADKDAEASILEETKKPMLSQLVQQELEGSRAAGGKGLSFAQAENNALANPSFEAHLKSMVDARRAANRAKVRYESGKIVIDLKRTLIATRRAEMQMGSYRT